MVATSYDAVVELAEALSPEDKARLIQRLEHECDPVAPVEEKKHSIHELRGLGKEIWQGIDAKEYVRTLRDEWDG